MKFLLIALLFCLNIIAFWTLVTYAPTWVGLTAGLCVTLISIKACFWAYSDDRTVGQMR